MSWGVFEGILCASVLNRLCKHLINIAMLNFLDWHDDGWKIAPVMTRIQLNPAWVRVGNRTGCTAWGSRVRTINILDETISER